ncbi:hypothetical protein FAM09_02140 [Niastella caeni]|uniref:Uncharacterized protein n=1 Tax=Niastella caeni TaxID=2569763 RepID=A0A4S8HYW3_9BACT|nr:hypothetical protein [Niastella caeni]THU40937.1 hypothetical protein FAM09_02140 [Niastella caeni]
MLKSINDKFPADSCSQLFAFEPSGILRIYGAPGRPCHPGMPGMVVMKYAANPGKRQSILLSEQSYFVFVLVTVKAVDFVGEKGY